MIKKLFCTVILSFCLSNTFGQRKGVINTNTTVSSAKNYFTENLSLLDEIEGIYDVSMIPNFSGGNMLVGFRTWGGQEYSTTAFICKLPTGSYVVRFTDTKGVPISQTMTLTNIGSTNAYRLEGRYSERYSHFSNSGVLSFDISKRIVYDKIGFALNFSGNDQYHKVDMEMSFIKTFPDATTTMKKQQELSTPKLWTGSGFALNDGYVVTNNHVVENAKSIYVQGVNGNFSRKINASIIATDKNNDIAILKLDGIAPTSIPYSVKTSTSDVGEDVWVLGYPLTSTMGDEIKLTTGVVSAKSGFEGDVSLYQISAPIQPGNSGGPVFDGKGNLIGIVCAHHRGAENVSYAIKASYLRNLIESSVNHDILPKNNKISSFNLAGKVKSVKNYVYYITCSSTPNYGNSENISNNSYQNIGSTHGNGVHFKPDYNTHSSLVITDIEISSAYTALHCQYTNKEYGLGGRYSIDPNTYICDNTSGKKYVLNNTHNCAVSPQTTPIKYQQVSKFILYFPSIPSTTKEIDFIESPNSTWNIKGIKLTKRD